MKFHRFTKYGSLSNWGWYSTKEQALLDKEDEVGKILASLEDFVRQRQLVKNVINAFNQIKCNNDVKEKDYDALMVELDRLGKQAKQIRLEVLDSGSSLIPDAPTTFPNHQPEALIGEIRTFLEYRKQKRFANDDPFGSGFVIHYGGGTAARFDEVIGTGSKVLYTLDVDGILSIGDPRSTKHSVVAVGKECRAAGIAQLQIDDRTDMYLAMKDHEKRGLSFRKDLQTCAEKQQKDLKANAEYQEQQASELAIKLQGYVPPVIATKVVLLDFDSGHYAPSQAWKEAMAAWKIAGYKAKWNPDSRRV